MPVLLAQSIHSLLQKGEGLVDGICFLYDSIVDIMHKCVCYDLMMSNETTVV